MQFQMQFQCTWLISYLGLWSAKTRLKRRWKKVNDIAKRYSNSKKQTYISIYTGIFWHPNKDIYIQWHFTTTDERGLVVNIEKERERETNFLVSGLHICHIHGIVLQPGLFYFRQFSIGFCHLFLVVKVP